MSDSWRLPNRDANPPPRTDTEMGTPSYAAVGGNTSHAPCSMPMCNTSVLASCLALMCTQASQGAPHPRHHRAARQDRQSCQLAVLTRLASPRRTATGVASSPKHAGHGCASRSRPTASGHDATLCSPRRRRCSTAEHNTCYSGVVQCERGAKCCLHPRSNRRCI